MQLGSCLSASYLFEVEQEDSPMIGNTYQDSIGNKWCVRGVSEGGRGVLRDPIPIFPIWTIQLEAGFGVAFQNSKILKPILEYRIINSNKCELKLITFPTENTIVTNIIGFGKMNDKYSWIFRTFKDTWQFMVGPLVNKYSEFDDSIFERIGDYKENTTEFPWTIVKNCVNEFLKKEV